MERGRGVLDKVRKDNLGIKRKMTNCTFGYNGIVHEILRHSFLVSISQYVYNKLSRFLFTQTFLVSFISLWLFCFDWKNFVELVLKQKWFL